MKEKIKTPRIKKGDRVFWLDPAREADGTACCREYTVTERKSNMLVLDGLLEALHQECYLKSEYCCPRCGRPLYYEKSYHARYPFVCPVCDENFFEFECDKDLSYGHLSDLEGRFDRFFGIAGDTEDEREELRMQALTTFQNDWRDGNIRNEEDFYEAYRQNAVFLKSNKWWSNAPFGIMERVTGLHETDYSPEDGSREFVNACEAWWSLNDFYEKQEIYEKNTGAYEYLD